MRKLKTLSATLFIAMFILTTMSCREKTTSEKIEDGIEEVGDELEDAGDDLKEGAEDIKDEVEDAVDDN